MLTRADIDTLLADLKSRLPDLEADPPTFAERFNEAYFAIAEQTAVRDHRYLEERAADILEQAGRTAGDPR